jgi:tetratricopeptide (TPR) repeat protein
MKYLLIFTAQLFSIIATAQINCNVYKNDPACFEACELSEKAADYQGHASSQQDFDKVIELCPTFDYAYFEKAVPYLKRGLFIEWKILIDKAVALNPLGHLGYRGWCRYQFLRDYKGAIEDLERLDALTEFDIGYSVNGDYHLKIALALCYKAIGQTEKGIAIIEAHKKSKDYVRGPYDELHLGVMKFLTKDFQGAMQAFNTQTAYNDFQAENYYYLALINKELNRPEEVLSNLQKAKSFYLARKHLNDPYTHHADRVFLAQIEDLLKKESQ